MAETETAAPEVSASPPETTTAPPDRAVVLDWRAKLPEDLRAEKSLGEIKGATWDDVGPLLAKGYVNAQKLVGQKLPEGVTAQQITEFLAKKSDGAPASPDKYDVKAPRFPPEMGIPWDHDAQAAFLGEMHAAGAPPAVVQRALDFYGQYMLRAHDAQKQQDAAERKQAETALRMKWGSAYERNLGRAYAAAVEIGEGNPALLAAAEDAGNNPGLLEILYRAADVLFEHQEVRGDAPGGQTIEQIEAELTRIRDDPKNAGNLGVVDRIHALHTTLDRLKERAARK